MAKKTILRDKKKDEAGEILPLTPTPDFDDPGRDRGFKPGRTYKSGTLYEKETGRYETPGMNGSLEKPGLRGHAKKTKPDTGSWNRPRVEKGEKVAGASRGVGQPSVDRFIEGLERNRKRKK